MKARHEFGNDSLYYEYLRDYYIGQMLIGKSNETHDLYESIVAKVNLIIQKIKR